MPTIKYKMCTFVTNVPLAINFTTEVTRLQKRQEMLQMLQQLFNYKVFTAVVNDKDRSF